MPTLAVVIASTRPGRAGAAIGRWFADAARTHGGFDVDVVDLAELDLPLLDEPNHPRLGQYVNAHTRRWSERVDAADAVVFVTPEYNHGYPAAVKNAIDYLYGEWRHKAVGFVSYGGISAGTRAAAQLRQVVTALKMVPVGEAVSIPFHTKVLDGSGAVSATDAMRQATDAMLDELLAVDAALAPLRARARKARAA